VRRRSRAGSAAARFRRLRRGRVRSPAEPSAVASGRDGSLADAGHGRGPQSGLDHIRRARALGTRSIAAGSLRRRPQSGLDHAPASAALETGSIASAGRRRRTAVRPRRRPASARLLIGPRLCSLNQTEMFAREGGAGEFSARQPNAESKNHPSRRTGARHACQLCRSG
jgi:hypothetical protein